MGYVGIVLVEWIIQVQQRWSGRRSNEITGGATSLSVRLFIYKIGCEAASSVDLTNPTTKIVTTDRPTVIKRSAVTYSVAIINPLVKHVTGDLAHSRRQGRRVLKPR